MLFISCVCISRLFFAVVTCWERADLLALVCDVYCVFVTFPFGVLGKGRYLIVSIPHLCRLSYFHHSYVKFVLTPICIANINTIIIFQSPK